MKYTVSDLTDAKLEELATIVYGEQRRRISKKELDGLRKRIEKSKMHIRVYAEVDEYDDSISYRFVHVKGKKELDFYYEAFNGNYTKMQSFIPSGFFERCENQYEFDGTEDEAKKVLTSVGITDIVLR